MEIGTDREHSGCWPAPGAAGRYDAAQVGPDRAVRELMLRTPLTLPSGATVADVRAVLADDHVHMVLLTDADVLRGTVVRDDLSPGPGGHGSALRYARLADRTIPPGAGEAEARRLLARTGSRRLAVVGPTMGLLGLLCLKRHGRGYCSDADVAARAASRATAAGT